MIPQLITQERKDQDTVETADLYDLMKPADEFDETGRTKDLVDLFN